MFLTSRNVMLGAFIVVFVLGSPCWALQDAEQSTEQEQQAQRPAYLPRGALHVGNAIHDVHVDYIAIVLKLSPEQEAAVRRLREAYALGWWAALPQERERIQELATLYNAEMRLPKRFNTAELAAEMRSLGNILRAELNKHDEGFFTQIEAMLTDEQRAYATCPQLASAPAAR